MSRLLFHDIEEAVKSGILKRVKESIEAYKSELKGSEFGLLIKTAIQKRAFPIVRYLFLGELYDQYSPDTTETLAITVRLSGRNVFNTPEFEKTLAIADSVDIMRFLQAFQYDVTSKEAFHQFMFHKSFRILTTLLESNELSDHVINSCSLNDYSYEMLLLVNSTIKVVLPAKAYSAEWEDERKNEFRNNEFVDKFTFENLELAISNKDVVTASEILNKIKLTPEQQQTCLVAAGCSNRDESMFAVLINHGLRLMDLYEFYEFFKNYHVNRNSWFVIKVLSLIKEDTRRLMESNPEFRKMMLSMTVEIQNYLITAGFILPTKEVMHHYLQELKGNNAGVRLIALFKLGFPVEQLDLNLFSQSTIDHLTPLIKFFNTWQNNKFLKAA